MNKNRKLHKMNEIAYSENCFKINLEEQTIMKVSAQQVKEKKV